MHVARLVKILLSSSIQVLLVRIFDSHSMTSDISDFKSAREDRRYQLVEPESVLLLAYLFFPKVC